VVLPRPVLLYLLSLRISFIVPVNVSQSNLGCNWDWCKTSISRFRGGRAGGCECEGWRETYWTISRKIRKFIKCMVLNPPTTLLAPPWKIEGTNVQICATRMQKVLAENQNLVSKTKYLKSAVGNSWIGMGNICSFHIWNGGPCGFSQCPELNPGTWPVWGRRT
jgi:hypothetical protein